MFIGLNHPLSRIGFRKYSVKKSAIFKTSIVYKGFRSTAFGEGLGLERLCIEPAIYQDRIHEEFLEKIGHGENIFLVFIFSWGFALRLLDKAVA